MDAYNRGYLTGLKALTGTELEEDLGTGTNFLHGGRASCVSH